MTSKSYTTREWALQLVAWGFGVFIIPPGMKYNDEMHWHQATTDPARVEAWFAIDDTINIGVTAGITSDGEARFILDVDPEGLLDFALWEAEHGAIPGPRVQTPSTGVHVFMLSPYGIKSGKQLGTGFDCRGTTKHVAFGHFDGEEAVPAVGDKPAKPAKPAGDYTVISDEPPQQVPTWLLPKLGAPKVKRERGSQEAVGDLDRPMAIKGAHEWLYRQPEIMDGNRDNELFYRACELKELGLSEETVADMIEEYNDSHVHPPLEEWRVKVRSAYTSGTNAPGSKRDVLYEQQATLIEGCQDVASLTFVADAIVGAAVASGDSNKYDKIFFEGDDVLTSGQKREYIIPGWLIAHGYTALLAKRGGGKTVVMLDIALRIAHRMDWHDGWPIKSEGWSVVYICGEDSAGLREQIKAWNIKNGKTGIPKNFKLIDGMVDLGDNADVNEVCRAIGRKLGEEADENNHLHVLNRAAVFVDTWQRATASLGQNNDDEMQPAIKAIEIICNYCRGPGVIACHPPKGKDDTIAGSAVIENSSTAIWILEVMAGGMSRELKVTRIKGKGDGNKRVFEFKEIPIVSAAGELVKDEFGMPETGVVPIRRGGNEWGLSTEQNREIENRENNDKRAALASLIKHAMNFKFPDLPTLGVLLVQKKALCKALSKMHDLVIGDANSEIAMLWRKYGGSKSTKEMPKALFELFPGNEYSYEYGRNGNRDEVLVVKNDGDRATYTISEKVKSPIERVAEADATAALSETIEQKPADDKPLDSNTADALNTLINGETDAPSTDVG